MNFHSFPKVAAFTFASLLSALSASAQVEALHGKTLTVQGQSVASVLLTFNADGSFIQCSPGFACEVLGEYKASAGGNITVVYKNLFFNRQTLVREVVTREGVISEKTLFGRSVLKVEEGAMVALAGDQMKDRLIGRTT
ncbi:MAG: hypothetical protein AB7P37_20950 [Ramlibacter sp.]